MFALKYLLGKEGDKVSLKLYDANIQDAIVEILPIASTSKQFQTGHGFTTYLYNNTNKCYHPLNFIGFIANLKDDDLIVNIKEDYLRRKLNDVLSQLGLDKNLYSWHSFRRGGATLASQHHIDPAIIKTHGRWLSEAYLLYVDNDHDSAGLQISYIL